jgi:hypothetical protein
VNHKEWAAEYDYDPHHNFFIHKSKPVHEANAVENWFGE